MRALILFIKGLVLGCTAVIPGVSFGTLALVLEIYTDGIHYLRVLLSVHKWKKNKSDVKQAFIFMTPLFLGILIAMKFFASLILYLFENHEIFLRCTFLGIILGSIPFIFKKHIREYYSKETAWKCVFFSSLSAIGLIFLGLQTTGAITSTTVDINSTEILKALIFGIITSISGMLPGISGSYILLMLGYYSSFLFILNNTVVPLAIPFFIGCFIGIGFASVLIDTMIRKYPAVSYAIILGMMIAALVSIVPWSFIQDFSVKTWFLSSLFILLGVILAVLSMKLGVSKQKVAKKLPVE